MPNATHDDYYLRKIFFSIVYLGTIIILFVPNSSYFGYAIAAGGLSLVMLVFYEYIVADAVNATRGLESNFSKLITFLKYLVVDGLPIFMVFSIVVYLLSLTLSYNDLIVSGNVTSQYVNFRNISAIFLVIESIMLDRYLSEKKLGLSGATQVSGATSLTGRAMEIMANNLGLLITLFATIHILVVMVISMNLKYFTTEGMCGKKKCSGSDRGCGTTCGTTTCGTTECNCME